MLRDVPLAEELTQDALVAALEAWPAIGVPDKPGAWLMATAKRRALDHLRRGKMLARKHEMLALDLVQEQETMPDFDAALDDDIGDELLRLIFTACHPLLSREARAALALRMICGLTTDEIARAFLVPEATIAQRIVRAKRTLSRIRPCLRDAARRGACRSGSPRCWRSSISSSTRAIPPRAATNGCGRSSATRRCAWAACSLGLAPDEPEVHGLLALMELNAARTRGAHRRERRAHSADGPGSHALGSARRSAAACARSTRAASSAARAASTRCRPRSSPCHATAETAASHRLAAHRAALCRAGASGAEA